ncbi:MAG: hypothetical protein ACM3WU_08525 [Bacillota bacterium]
MNQVQRAVNQVQRNDDGPGRSGSYMEIEIGPMILNLFERQGDGKTAEVIQALARYGLHLATRVSSPCG